MILNPDRFDFLGVPEVDLSILKDFDCGVAELNTFLFEKSLVFQAARMGFTFCVFHPDFDGLVAYITLSNDALILNDSEKFELGMGVEAELSFMPAVKIGKFAVAKQLASCGNGRIIINLIIHKIADFSGMSAARFVVVDAKPGVTGFYAKLGFLDSLHARRRARSGSKTVKMFKDIFSN